MYGTGFGEGLDADLGDISSNLTWTTCAMGLRKYHHSTDNFGVRQGTRAKGVITVQYPDEKIAVPERFRFVPFLIVGGR